MEKLKLLKKWQKVLLVVACFVIVIIVVNLFSKDSGGELKAAGEVFKAAGVYDDGRYYSYIAQYSNADFNGDVIQVDAASAMVKEAGSSVVETGEYEGKKAVLTEEEGTVSFAFKVNRPGLYAIKVDYYTVEGYGSNIERGLLIDGEYPYGEYEDVEFTRIYVDEVPNASGETVRPNQIEKACWNSEYVMDADGYWAPAMYCYLAAGDHVMTFASVKEPMAIGQITLESRNISPSPYEEVYQAAKAQGAQEVTGVLEEGICIIQAENAIEKSSPTLYAKSDTSSTKNQPYSFSEKLLNVIGGEAWQYSNQWITWEFTVPADGYYNIGIRAKQNFIEDIYFNRSLYIDGELPFAEATDVHFYHDDNWQVFSFGEENGKDAWKFYLKAGTHTITLKNTVGDMVSLLTEADAILTELSAVNLDLLALLSTTPDTDRDYQIALYMPDTLEQINRNKERLNTIYNAMVEMTGARAALTSQLEQLISVLDKMYSKPSRIASNYKRFRDLLGSFGEWINTVRQQPLMVDYLYVAEASVKPEDANDGFGTKVVTQVMNFAYSFINDYSMISSGETGSGDTVTVWIGSGLTGGRDQAMALNRMIQDSFTAQTGINVNLQLVPASTLLTATLSGRGPDLALQVPQTEPVDFALRSAAYDLTNFADFNEVAARYSQNAIDPFVYDGGVYAMPETMSFPMLFYRTDIMEELGIDVSQLETWDSIIEILAILQAQNMNFALPATMGTYSMFLYQMNGDYYTEDHMASALGRKVSLDAFEYWTDFYKLYGLPVDFSFENRFRTGEIPIGVSEYTTYNLLTISAPEIKGKWAMIELPGIVQEDGTINNVAPITVQGCMMLNSCKNKDAAWEFVKWWTSSEIQYEFGEQLEAVMGAAARYNTANLDALMQFSWAGKDRKSLEGQTRSLRGMPQIPGGYYTERNLNFAKLAVINDDDNPRESLMEHSDDITEEITMKRKEFGLKTIED